MSIKHFFAHNQLNFLGKKVHFYVKDNIWLLKMAYEQASLSLGISLFTKKPKKNFISGEKGNLLNTTIDMKPFITCVGVLPIKKLNNKVGR